MNTPRQKIDFDKSTWQYEQRDDIFTGGTYAQGEMCMRRPEIPEGFINESTIIGHKAENAAPNTGNADVQPNVQPAVQPQSVTPPVNEPVNSEPEDQSPKSVPAEEAVQENSTSNESTEPAVSSTEPTRSVTTSITETIDKRALLTNPDWGVIASMVRDGTAKNVFSVGDTFNSTIKHNTSTKKYPWIVADFKDVLDNFDDSAQVHNAMILIAKYAAIVKLPFNNGDSNSYSRSIIRQYLNSNSENPDWFVKYNEEDSEYTPEVPGFISCLPEDFVSAVKSVYNTNTDNLDTFWIPTITEMNVLNESLNRQEGGDPLQYFVNLSGNEKINLGEPNEDYKFKRANATSTPVTYWTMSPSLENGNMVYVCFGSNGAIGENAVNDTLAIVPVCAIY